MKKKQAIWFVLMLCWWGLLFPELTFSEDNLRVIYAEEMSKEEKASSNQSQWETYVDFLRAEPEQIKVKSKLFEWLKGLCDS